MNIEKPHVRMLGPLPQEDAQSYLDGFQGRNDLKVGPNMLAWALESMLARLDEAAAALAKLQAENQALENSVDGLSFLNAKLQAERDEALRQTAAYARAAGLATGKLETSEAAGIVEGWKERAEKAEAERDEAREALRPFAEAWDDCDFGQSEDYPRMTFEVHNVNCYPTALPHAVQHNAWWDAMALGEKLSPSPALEA